MKSYVLIVHCNFPQEGLGRMTSRRGAGFLKMPARFPHSVALASSEMAPLFQKIAESQLIGRNDPFGDFKILHSLNGNFRSGPRQ